MGLGRTQGGGDPLIMIAQVRRRLRLPDHLLGVNGLPVYHRRGLAVAAAQVDADAAALRPGCCRGRRFPLRGQRLSPLHLKGRTVYTGQKRPVKGPRPRRGVRPLQPTVNRLIRREKGAAPSQPQGGFYQEQRIFLVCRRHSPIPVQAQGQMLAAPGPGHRHGDPAVRRGLVAAHKVNNGPELSPHR